MLGFFRKKLSPGQKPPPPQQPRLTHVVPRNSRTELGAFEDINRDLGSFVEANFETCDLKIKMAYAYARRTAVAGLFFQGIVGENLVRHVQDIFVGLQKLTGQTIAFQEEAAAQANEFVRTYVPQLNSDREKVLVNYAREGLTALELASNEALDFEIDELEEDPVKIDTCIALIDRIFEVSRILGMSLSPSVHSAGQKRLIDLVEKATQAKLGPFASMGEDVRLTSQSFRGNNILFAAAGYAMLLSACGTYVAGGVHSKIITDYAEVAQVLIADIGDDPEAHRICSDQAIALASTYVPTLTKEAAEIIIETGLELDVFASEGEGRLSPEEVVLRAKRIARSRTA